SAPAEAAVPNGQPLSLLSVWSTILLLPLSHDAPHPLYFTYNEQAIFNMIACKGFMGLAEPAFLFNR
ncbi:MAG: hypothetical protein ABJN05_00085, partial [Sulfitobacter dubius]